MNPSRDLKKRKNGLSKIKSGSDANVDKNVPCRTLHIQYTQAHTSSCIELMYEQQVINIIAIFR